MLFKCCWCISLPNLIQHVNLPCLNCVVSLYLQLSKQSHIMPRHHHTFSSANGVCQLSWNSRCSNYWTGWKVLEWDIMCTFQGIFLFWGSTRKPLHALMSKKHIPLILSIPLLNMYVWQQGTLLLRENHKMHNKASLKKKKLLLFFLNIYSSMTFPFADEDLVVCA